MAAREAEATAEATAAARAAVRVAAKEAEATAEARAEATAEARAAARAEATAEEAIGFASKESEYTASGAEARAVATVGVAREVVRGACSCVARSYCSLFRRRSYQLWSCHHRRHS